MARTCWSTTSPWRLGPGIVVRRRRAGRAAGAAERVPERERGGGCGDDGCRGGGRAGAPAGVCGPAARPGRGSCSSGAVRSRVGQRGELERVARAGFALAQMRGEARRAELRQLSVELPRDGFTRPLAGCGRHGREHRSIPSDVCAHQELVEIRPIPVDDRRRVDPGGQGAVGAVRPPARASPPGTRRPPRPAHAGRGAMPGGRARSARPRGAPGSRSASAAARSATATSSGSPARPISSRSAASDSGSRASARRTSRQTTLPDPSQIDWSGCCR